MAKLLKDLLTEVFENDAPNIDKHKVVEGVAQYSIVGKHLYSEHNILEIAEQLVQISEAAQSHVLSETDEWFDKVSINRNMKSLNGMVKEFKKTATEYNGLSQRLTALYEDMGTILNRYYDINEEANINEEGDSAYQDFFRKALEKFGVSEPDQLDGDKKRDFFNYVDKNWTGEKETD